MNQIGAKPVEYLVLAWLSSVGTALLLAGIAAVIGVAYAGEFDSPLWQQALVGVLAALLVAMTQYLLAQTVCFVILHSRSLRVPVDTVIGTGHRNSNIVVALPFETTRVSRVWVAVHHSGWRVFIAIYAVVLAIVISSDTQNALPALPLLAVAVALGFWHADHVAKERRAQTVDAAAEAERRARYEKGLAARERRAARAATAPITDSLIDAELTRAFTKTAVSAIKKGDLAKLDTYVTRAHVALGERVPLDQLRQRALDWVAAQP